MKELTGQEVTNDALLSREKLLDENERWYIRDIIQDAKEAATKSKTEGKILDYEKWLYQQSIFFAYAAFQLETLRNDLLKTHWKAENNEEKEKISAKYGDIGEILFHEAARARREELSEIALRSRERAYGNVEVRISRITTEISEQVNESAVEWAHSLPPGFFHYSFSFLVR